MIAHKTAFGFTLNVMLFLQMFSQCCALVSNILKIISSFLDADSNISDVN